MPDVKHESADINSRPILWTATLLLATVVAVHFALSALQTHLQRQGVEHALVNVNPLGVRRNAHPTDEQLAAVPPPRLEGLQELQDGAPPYRSSLPRREGNPPEYHSNDLDPATWPQLVGYAWVNKPKGVARIPIDQAMAAVLKMDRLPTQPGAENVRPPAPGATRIRASSSGQAPREEGRP